MTTNRAYNFDRFLRYGEMVSWLNDLAQSFPHLVSLETYGKSHMGRDLLLATVTDATTGEHDTKPAHWIDANIHTRSRQQQSDRLDRGGYAGVESRR